ncbi:MAG: hypothetical protein GX428_03370 [Candidatus Atribacteria bacterium]|nr:hypothetical protein [Candidatus Atribacteria bacterium]
MKRILFSLLTLFFFGFFPYLAVAEEWSSENSSVEIGNALMVNTTVEISLGDITLTGGATKLMGGEFQYPSIEWKPLISYQVKNMVGELKIQIPTNTHFSLFRFRDLNHKTLIRLNDFVPMNLFFKVGAGKSQVDLGSMTLETLTIEAGAGEVMIDLKENTSLSRFHLKTGVGKVTIDLRGNWLQDVDSKIISGLGEVTLFLPQNIGVRVETKRGLGAIDASHLIVNGNIYTNQLYGKTQPTLNIYLESGIGKVNLY